MNEEILSMFRVEREKGECIYCSRNCDCEHSFVEDKEFVPICDDCLSDKLAENPNFKRR